MPPSFLLHRQVWSMRAVELLASSSFGLAVARSSRFLRSQTSSRPLTSKFLRSSSTRTITLPPTLLFAVSALEKRQYAAQSMESADSAPVEFPADFCELLTRASSHGPGFKVDANSVEIVREPSEFFNSLVVRGKHNSCLSVPLP